MSRIKYFSAEDARRLVAGEVSEVVVSDDTTIVYNCNQFLRVENGREYNSYVPHSYITDGDYDAIAKDIRPNSIYPRIEFKENIVSIVKIDNSELTALIRGEIEKIDIECNPCYYSIYVGELFYNKDTRVFVVRIFETNDEYELGGNIMDNLTEIIHMLYPIDDAINGEYIDLEEYIGRAWSHNQFNFEVIDIEGNTWYSCNKDKDGKRLPIMDWHIGNANKKLKKSIRDAVSDYYGLIETGHILNSIIVELLMDIGRVISPLFAK